MPIIYYTEADLELGLEAYLKKLVIEGRIGEYGIYLLRSAIPGCNVEFDPETVVKKVEVVPHHIYKFKNSMNNKVVDDLYVFGNGASKTKRLDNIFQSSTSTTQEEFFADLKTREKTSFEYAINNENKQLIDSVKLKGIFDIRQENGRLRKYFCGKRRSALGINVISVYVGCAKSGFPMHIEDLALWSLNLALQGNKRWFSIKIKRSGDLFGKLRTMSGQTCNWFHFLKIFFCNPKLLLDWGFEVDEMTQEKGDIIITLPNGIHWGLNLTYVVNIAINFADLLLWPRWALKLCSVPHTCTERRHAPFVRDVKEMLLTMGIDKKDLELFYEGKTDKFEPDVSSRDVVSVDLDYHSVNDAETHNEDTEIGEAASAGCDTAITDFLKLCEEDVKYNKNMKRCTKHGRSRRFEVICPFVGCSKGKVCDQGRLEKSSIAHLQQHQVKGRKCPKCSRLFVDLSKAMASSCSVDYTLTGMSVD